MNNEEEQTSSQDTYDEDESESSDDESLDDEEMPDNMCLTGVTMSLIEKPKNPHLIVILSVLFPGLGHFVLGQKGKGIIYLLYILANLFIVPVVLEGVLFVLAMLMWFLFLGWVFHIIQLALTTVFPWIWTGIYIFQVFEAYALAIRLKEGYPLGKWECRYSVLRMHFPISLTCFSTTNPIIASKEWKRKVTAVNKRKGIDYEFEEISLE